VAVAHACEAGRDAQRLAADLAEYLRQGFLAIVAGELVSLSGGDRSRVEETARQMGLPALVRALEELGRAQVDMRDVPDARVHLEVTLIKLTHPQADDSTTALLERVDRLERALADGGGFASGAPVPTTPARTVEAPPSPAGTPPPAHARGAADKDRPSPPEAGSETPGAGRPDAEPPSPGDTSGAAVGGPELARRTLGAVRRQSGSGRRPPRTEPPGGGEPSSPGPNASAATDSAAVPSASAASAAPSGQVGDGGAVATLPSRDELVQIWGDGLLAGLPNRARARFRVGRFLDFDGGAAVFALPNETHRSYCEAVRLDVEAALGARFGTSVPIRLVVDDDAVDDGAAAAVAPPARRAQGVPATAGEPGPAPGGPSGGGGAVESSAPDDDAPDLLDPEVLAFETEPAGVGLTPQERVKQAFPGAHEV
jgi:DNA polymerase-3 subunit gamma/tau